MLNKNKNMKELINLKNFVKSLFITTVVIFLTIFIYIGVKEISATMKVKQIEIGDKFKVEYLTENPYENSIVFGGTVISKKGNYIQYVNSKGDTTSTNIRDMYKFPKTFRIVIIKQK